MSGLHHTGQKVLDTHTGSSTEHAVLFVCECTVL